jgi:hypothetical protein
VASAAVERIFSSVVQAYSPDVMRQMFIDTAQKGIADFVARNPGTTYSIEVNGASVSSESSLPAFSAGATAVISYVIQRMSQIGRFALDTAMSISPQ